MRLTLVNQFYPPELAPTGHLMASLARHRAKLGDEVKVITSRGGYVPEIDAADSQDDAELSVHRLWVPRLGKSTAPRRIVDYSVFFILAILRALTLPRQDLIICLTTPPFIALAGVLHRLLHKDTAVVVWIMDRYPEVLEAAGSIRPEGLADRAMIRMNRWLFRRVDALVCLDGAMASGVSGRYLGAERTRPDVLIVPNWEPAGSYPHGGIESYWESANELDLYSRFVMLYLGNAGYGHRFDTVLAAAEQLSGGDFSFVFVGGGVAWPMLHEEVARRHLENVHLLGYVPKDATPSVLAAADCGLITLRDEFLGLISPSKLHAYLATGLPVAYIGPEGSNVDEAIRRFDCGESIRHGEVERLVGFIRRLRDDSGYAQQIADRSRIGFQRAYTEAVNLARFDQLLDRLVSRLGARPRSG